MVEDKKLAIVVHGFFSDSFGGVPVFIRNLAEEFAGRGYGAFVVTKSRTRRYVVSQPANGMKVYEIPVHIAGWFPSLSFLSFIGFWFSLFVYSPRIFRVEKPLCIHGHGVVYGGVQSVVLGKVLNVPTVVTVHGLDRRLSRTMAVFLKRADLIVVQTNAMREKLIRSGFREKSIVEIPNGIRRQTHADTRISKRIRVLFVGRFDTFREPLLFVNSAYEALMGGFEGEFVMIGDGPLYPETMRRIRELGIQDRVILTGRLDNLSEHYANADVYVACSPIENYSSLSLLEAMSFGLAIIATDVGETRRIAEDKVNAILCRAESRSISSALLRLQNQPNLIVVLGKKNLKLIADEFDIQLMTDRYENAFKGVMDGRNRRRI